MPNSTDSGSIVDTTFLDALSTFSVSVWLKIAVATTANFMIVCKRDTTNGGNGWIFVPSDTTGLLAYQSDAAYNEHASNKAFGDGSWHNCIFVCNFPSNTIFYVDGAAATSSSGQSPSAPSTNSRTFHVGTDTSNQTMTALKYANIKCWNTALTSGNASTIASGGNVPGGQIANWNFSEGSGTTATDTISNRVLTFSNVNWSSDIPSQLVATGATPQRMMIGVGL